VSAVLPRQCILEWCAIRPAIRRIGMQLETCWWSLYEPTWLQSSSFRRPVPLSGIPEWTFNNSLAAKCKRSVRRRKRVNSASAWKKLNGKLARNIGYYDFYIGCIRGIEISEELKLKSYALLTFLNFATGHLSRLIFVRQYRRFLYPFWMFGSSLLTCRTATVPSCAMVHRYVNRCALLSIQRADLSYDDLLLT